MKNKPIESTIHGILDYLLAVFCVLYSWVSGLYEDSKYAFYISIGCAAFFVLQASVTKFRPGVFKLIPMTIHLKNDLFAAILFMLTPFLFGLTGLHLLYFVVTSAGIIVVGCATSSTDYVNTSNPTSTIR